MKEAKQVRIHSLGNPLGRLVDEKPKRIIPLVQTNSQIERAKTIKKQRCNSSRIEKGLKPFRSMKRFGGYKIPMV